MARAPTSRDDLVERAEGVLGGYDLNSRIVPPTCSRIEEEGLGLRVVLPEAAEASEIIGPYVLSHLDLDRHQAPLTVQHEINLVPVGCPPVVERIAEIAVVVQRPQLLEHQRFQGRTADFLGSIEWTPWPDGLIDAGIEEVELWMGDDAALGPPREDGKPDGDQQILEDAEVILR